MVDSKRACVGGAGVEGAGGFEEEDTDFFFGDRAVFDATRYNEEFAGLQRDGVGKAVGIAMLHFEFSLDHEKEFVFKLVVMPDKFSREFDQFDVLAIEFSNDFWRPVCGELVELFG